MPVVGGQLPDPAPQGLGQCLGCGVGRDRGDPRTLVGEASAFVGFEPGKCLGDDVEVVARDPPTGEQIGQLRDLLNRAGAASGALCLAATGVAAAGDGLGRVDRWVVSGELLES